MRVVRVAIDALALLAAGLLVPGIEIELAQDAVGAVAVLILLALVFGLLNTLVRPASRLLAIPGRLLTLGLFAALVNAALLLVAAGALAAVDIAVLRMGGFPPRLDLEAIASAAAGGVIIGAISTLLSISIRDP